MQVRMNPVTWDELVAKPEPGKWDTATALRQVLQARARQAARFGSNGTLNARIPSSRVMNVCRLTAPVAKLLDQGVQRFGLSARAVHRTLRVARTIADLDDREAIEGLDLAEALGLRAGSGAPRGLSGGRHAN